jgi:ribose/xylose/arabinose/galactoside ABC-type transport system permease subunit
VRRSCAALNGRVKHDCEPRNASEDRSRSPAYPANSEETSEIHFKAASPYQGRLTSFFGSEFFVLFLCAAAFLIFALTAPGFASRGNLWNIFISALPLLLLATGQTVVLITAGIDLSITAAIGLSSIAGALVMSGDAGWLAGRSLAAPAAILAMFAAGALVGFVNGGCIAWLRMPAFMVTLTTMMFFSGFAIWLAKRTVNAESIYNLPAAFLVIGTKPWLGAALAIGATILAHVLLSRTLLGRWLYAVGHNARTSLVSGVPVSGVIVSAYMISGLFAALASILLSATLETGSPNHGRALLLDVIGAAVIGGTSLFGGKGKVLWTIYGVLFLSLLGNGLNQLNFSDFMITIIKGSVILLAALLDRWRTRFACAP